MSELRYWLWLSALQNLSPRSAKSALYAFPSVTALYFASESDLKRVPGLRPSELRALCFKDISVAEGIEETCRKQDIRMICLPDAAYPERLRNIDDPPLVLYVKGDLPPVDDCLCIGVVGTRRASSYGRDIAGRIGGAFLERHGLLPRVAVTSENLETLLDLCLAGEGACFCPKELAEKAFAGRDASHLLEISLEARFSIRAAWLNRPYIPRAITDFVALCAGDEGETPPRAGGKKGPKSPDRSGRRSASPKGDP